MHVYTCSLESDWLRALTRPSEKWKVMNILSIEHVQEIHSYYRREYCYGVVNKKKKHTEKLE